MDNAHAARIASLSPEKLALLLKRLEGRRGTASPTHPVPRLPSRPGRYPLSPVQARLWFVHRLDPRGSSYNLTGAVRVFGALRVPALRAALRALVADHEILRTTYGDEGDGPVQRVWPPAGASLPVVDLRRLGAARAGAEVRRLADADAARPFDLGAAPPLRSALVHVAAGEYVLLLTLHHIAGDAESLALLTREWAGHYAHSTRGVDPAAPLPLQYADYAVWRRDTMEEVLAAQLPYWRRTLSGLTAAVLPADYAPGARRARPAGHVPFHLPAVLAAPMEAVGRRHGATPFMAVLAGLLALLRWHTGGSSVPVGTPISHRDRAELRGVLGCFLNTLVLHAELTPGMTLCDAVERVRDGVLGAFAHRELPYDRLVGELRPVSLQGAASLFEVTFTFHDEGPAAPVHVDGLRFEPLETRGAGVRGTLHLDVSRTPEGALDGILTYDAARFLPDTAARLEHQLRTVFREMALTAQTTLQALDATLDAAARDWSRPREQAFREARRAGLRGAARRAPSLPAAGGLPSPSDSH